MYVYISFCLHERSRTSSFPGRKRRNTKVHRRRPNKLNRPKWLWPRRILWTNSYRVAKRKISNLKSAHILLNNLKTTVDCRVKVKQSRLLPFCKTALTSDRRFATRINNAKNENVQKKTQSVLYVKKKKMFKNSIKTYHCQRRRPTAVQIFDDDAHGISFVFVY